MKGRRFERLAKEYLLPALPAYHVKGRLLFARPLSYLLRGFLCDCSRWDRNEFCVAVLVQPLFVPEVGIAYGVGGRLGSIRGKQEEWWTLSEDNERVVMTDVLHHMQREGPVILDKFKTLRNLADRAVAHHKNRHDLYVPEMAAYAAVLLDDARTAEEMFDCAERRYNMDDDRRDWVVALMDRIRRVRKVFECDPADAKVILNRWRDETAANLKLTEYLEPIPNQLT